MGLAPGSTPDHAARVKAVEEDLEYYRAKRLEPRILHFARKGIVPLRDLLGAGARPASKPRARPGAADDLEGRIAALERGLNAYIEGIGLIAWGLAEGVDFAVEDQRKEAGIYDDFFRVKRRAYPGGLEERIAALEANLADDRAVLEAFTRALVARGLLPREALAARGRGTGGPDATNGARIVARAWVDAGFRKRLLARGREALAALGLPTGGVGRLGVLEDTEEVHHIIVCTLCSCYPYDLLGNPPWWYKHDVYKERIVADPRGTLEGMFGLTLPPSVEVRVYDSTSDIRYMVLPRRPPGTEGMDEGALARWVSPESLIGTALPAPPPTASVGKGGGTGRRKGRGG